MEVILLERVENLGNVGDIAKVKNGYGRNYLLPMKKALRATAQNKLDFEARRSSIEADNIKSKKEAEKLAVKVEGQFLVLIRQAGEDGRLYGSVSARDISDATALASSVEVKRSQVIQFTPIKLLGIHSIKIALHPEVTVTVHVNVARSVGEAEIAKKDFLNPTTKKSEEVNAEEANVEVTAEEEDEGKHKKKKKKVAKVVDIELKDEDTAEQE